MHENRGQKLRFFSEPPAMRFSLISVEQRRWFFETCIEYRVCGSKMLKNIVFKVQVLNFNSNELDS